MKKTMWIPLFLGMLLLVPAISGAVVIDPSPDNFSWVNINWDYKNFGNYGDLKLIGGSQLRTGAAFRFECEIYTGGLLDNLGDVIRVEAMNTLTKKRYILHYDPFFWPAYGGIMQYWTLIVQPHESMFEGKWKFRLYYRGSDGNKHLQVLTAQPPAKIFPAQIAHVTVKRSGGSFEVSWSGIGNPDIPLINYRVLVFQGVDVIEDIHGDWEGGGTMTTGTYDTIANKVTFTIPATYAGEDYGIRLASSTLMNRSLYYLILPTF